MLLTIHGRGGDVIECDTYAEALEVWRELRCEYPGRSITIGPAPVELDDEDRQDAADHLAESIADREVA